MEIISNCPPGKKLIEFHCLPEDAFTFVTALTLPDIQATVQKRGLMVDIIPDESEEIEFQRQYVMAQYCLIVAAKTLSNYTDFTTERWLQRLYTYAYNRYVDNEPTIAGILSQYYPVEMLPNDPLASELEEKSNAEKVSQELMKIVRPESEKATISELNQLFEKLQSSDFMINLSVNLINGFVLVGQLQLALRHPANEGESSKRMKQFAQDLIDAIASEVPDARQYLEMGWHSEFDRG